ncbi:2-amino-4-hydroxy-6-hydroxymethyldihydropteridine diphosphokinase [Candidatus Peregrinibacteria bacterium]|nr:2-amino-4-hydroxy-6-hydroxymethyldihydropteridine diphosphokinase [Candidatus Peregrinibacteria bacterium]
MITAYLSLGSNVGDRLEHLMEAEKKLGETGKIKIIQSSRVYETEPWFPVRSERFSDRSGGPDGRQEGQPAAEKGHSWFLNRVLKIETDLNPLEFLETCEVVEKAMGRTHKKELKPRRIDIDILLYGDEVVDLPELQVPHRHMNNRQFVLVPLVELEPGLKDPVTKNLYRLILQNLEDSHKVTPFL